MVEEEDVGIVVEEASVEDVVVAEEEAAMVVVMEEVVDIILVVNRVDMAVDTIVVALQAITSHPHNMAVGVVVILNKVQDTSLKLLVEIRAMALVNNLVLHNHMVHKVMDNNQLHLVMAQHRLRMEVNHTVVHQHPVTVLKDIKVLDKVMINQRIKVVDTHKVHSLMEVLVEEAMVLLLLVGLVDMQMHNFDIWKHFQVGKIGFVI